MRRISILIIAAVLMPSGSVQAQITGLYAGLSMASAPLDAPSGFQGSRAAAPTGLVGFRFAERHSVEVSVSRLKAESTQTGSPGIEAPYTRGIEANPVSVTYRHDLAVGGSDLVPSVGIGVSLARVIDSAESDTPRERTASTAYGGVAEVGLSYRLAGQVSVTARAGYRHLERGSAAQTYELSGALFGVGLQFDF